LAALVATVLAAAVTFPIYRRLRQNSAQPKLTQVVATSKDVSVGVALSPDDVKLIGWPADAPLTGSFSKVQDVVGRPVIYALGAGEPVLERDLAVAGSGIGLSVKVPPGMRATAVRSNEIVGVAGFLFPGSHVDVLATITLSGSSSATTQTVLQDVEVLTAGQTIEPDPQGKPKTVNVVTLLLNPEDSQKLLLASGQGTIQFVLRNGTDQKKVEIKPTRLDEMAASAKVAITPHPVKRAAPPTAPPPKPPTVYVMEMIRGNERSVQKF
jgi:pilus assembly protein CpaB